MACLSFMENLLPAVRLQGEAPCAVGAVTLDCSMVILQPGNGKRFSASQRTHARRVQPQDRTRTNPSDRCAGAIHRTVDQRISETAWATSSAGGTIDRLSDSAQLASWTGTSPRSADARCQLIRYQAFAISMAT